MLNVEKFAGAPVPPSMGNTSERIITGRKLSVRVQRAINTMKKRITRNPRKTVRQIAKALNISQTFMRRIVKSDLEMKSCNTSNQAPHLLSRYHPKKSDWQSRRCWRRWRRLAEGPSYGQTKILTAEATLLTARTTGFARRTLYTFPMTRCNKISKLE